MLLIFDFDGTLADTWSWLADELQLGAGRLGYRQMTRAQIEELRGLETPAVFKALDIGPGQLQTVVEDLRGRAEMATRFQLFDGVQDLILRLHSSGHTMAVVSSNTESVVRATLDVPLQSRFSFYRCSSAVFGKADIFTDLMKEAGYAADATLAIGDETRDLEAAKGVGIAAIAVEWGFAKADLLRSIGYGDLAASVGQLGEMIETLDLIRGVSILGILAPKSHRNWHS